MIRSRFLLPAVVTLGVSVTGILTFGPGASASSTTGTAPTQQSSTAGGLAQTPGRHANPLKPYGSHSSIYYTAPPAKYIGIGKMLFEENCSSCHGVNANGVTGIAPNLQGLGPATVDFWVSTGRMPATTDYTVEAQRKPKRLNNKEALEVAAFVNSLDPSVPSIPSVNLSHANLAEGAELFSLNCAACHTITGAGDALAFGTSAPSLHQATATQIAEAMRIGPANMPLFTNGILSNDQARDVIDYVTSKIQHPNNAGGFGLGGIGPVTEGFVGLLFGVGTLVLVCFWIGDRSEREEDEEDEHGHAETVGQGAGH